MANWPSTIDDSAPRKMTIFAPTNLGREVIHYANRKAKRCWRIWNWTWNRGRSGIVDRALGKVDDFWTSVGCFVCAAVLTATHDKALLNNDD